MARTVNTIYNAILADKANYAELSDLSTTSQTGIWRLWAYITALAIHLHERIFDAFKVEVNELIAVGLFRARRFLTSVVLAAVFWPVPNVLVRSFIFCLAS